MPSVYALPLFEIEVGVALPRVATPPATENAKSPVSRSPLPTYPVPLAVLVSKTASEKVTVMVVLSEASAVWDIVGSTFSYRLIVLLLCVVDAAVPLTSKIALEAGRALSVSDPFGVPDRLTPNTI